MSEMIEFKTLENKTLQIDLNKYAPTKDYLVNVIGEDGEDYIMRNQDGITFNFPIEIIKVNNLKITNDEIRLSDTLYGHYFGKYTSKLGKEAYGLIYPIVFKRFDFLIENADLFLNNPEYFLLRFQYFSSGLFGAFASLMRMKMMGGGPKLPHFNYCLGSLLESYKYSDELIIDDHKELGRCYLIGVGGSVLSGVHTGTVWSEKQNTIMSLPDKTRTYHLPKDWMHYLMEFEKLHDRYPYKLEQDYPIHKRLYEDLLKRGLEKEGI